MKLSQVKGNTWVAEGMELIPFYKLDEHRCVLLDTGLLSEGEELEAALLEQGLTPAGVLCSHAHVDHCANSGYFQDKYRIPVALTAPEAAMCLSTLTLKCYFLTLSPDTVELESSCMIHTPDVVLPPRDGPVSFAGAEFTILHTPGHSAGHICTVTPDGVCYLADAVLSHELLGAKLPYNLSQAMAMDSREKLRGLPWDTYIMAHRGVCTGAELPALLDANQALIRTRAEEIRSLVTRPMTMSQIDAAVCAEYQLFTRKPHRALRFERNIRFFVEYLVDRGELEAVCRRGVACYVQSSPAPQGAAHIQV